MRLFFVILTTGGDSVKERIKYLRKNILGLTQEKFAESIGLKRNTIAMYEIGDKIPSERTIKDICREFNVNETWLRTGEGEMLKERTRNQEIAEFINDIMEEADDSFRKRVYDVFSKLTLSEWETLEKIANKLVKED